MNNARQPATQPAVGLITSQTYMTTKTTQSARRAAYERACNTERNALMNLRRASINRAWHEAKMKYPDALHLFRVGDFYELYGEDALAADKTLGITLTRMSSTSGDSLIYAGFPAPALDTYLPRLVHAGYRVTITEDFAELMKPIQAAWLTRIK